MKRHFAPPIITHEMDNETTQSALKDLPDEVLEQLLFAELVNNAEFTSQVVPIFKESWFSDDELRPMSKLVIKWRERFASNISVDLIGALLQKYIQSNPRCGIDLNTCVAKFKRCMSLDMGGMTDGNRIRTIKEFIKKNILKEAIVEGAKILSKDGVTGVADACMGILEDAERLSTIGEATSLTYSAEAISTEQNLQSKALADHYDVISNPSAKISTGWPTLDLYTNGGWPAEGKSLEVIMGQAGLGKTVALVNMGYNCLKQGLRVVNFTMELSNDMYGRRYDSLISNVDLDDLGPLVGTVKARVVDFFKQHPTAELIIKEFPPKGANINTFNAFINTLCKERGREWKPDVIIVDYLNLVAAAGGADDENMYQEGLKVSEQLRALSYRWKAPVLTAVQINREGMKNEDGPDMENISQSSGIAHTADFMFGIHRDDSGNIRGKIIKSRLGPATGQENVSFRRDDHTLRMIDMQEDYAVAAQQAAVSQKPKVGDNKQQPPSTNNDIPDSLIESIGA